MDKVNLATTPMIVRALKKDKVTFKPRKEGEEVLGQEYTYLNTIGVPIYLANNTRPDIAFAVNCLVKHSTITTIRH
jgi:hypothetical protein